MSVPSESVSSESASSESASSESVSSESVVRDRAFGLVPIVPASGDRPHHYLIILHNKGHWAFPKGHQDDGETALETACREFEEETGLTDYTPVPELTFSESYQFKTRQGTLVEKTVQYFAAVVPTDENGDFPPATVQAEEVSDYRWSSAAEAARTITFDGARQVLQECDRAITQPEFAFPT
ncbi:MAG: NUDIX domain-containing protein [Cyanobacteria bacterium J06639_1]